MVDIGIVLTGAIGIITTIISGWTSWFFARKKYNSEVDNNLIENMQKSLEFYKKLSDDNSVRLEIILKRNEALEKEVNELKNQVFTLMGSICIDMTCQLRKRDLNYLKKNKNETNIRENKKEK